MPRAVRRNSRECSRREVGNRMISDNGIIARARQTSLKTRGINGETRKKFFRKLSAIRGGGGDKKKQPTVGEKTRNLRNTFWDRFFYPKRIRKNRLVVNSAARLLSNGVRPGNANRRFPSLILFTRTLTSLKRAVSP